ncbi:MAG: COX15/CtaA family protein [Janthinobacterium lividum]
MPSDVAAPPLFRRLRLARRPAPRAVAAWLFVICAMLLVMIALGGATRLTGSGLSIMEWAPLMGTLPPMSETEWHRLYALYQQIPQYSLVHQGFGIEGFKGIFWLEWTHRLWGRLIGLAFLLPLIWFAVRGAIDGRLARRLGLLFLLGGLQGAIGWFMVASGFAADSTAVSPYRLVVHLTMALVLYSVILWTALGLWRDGAPAVVEPAAAPPALRRLSVAVLHLVALTVVAGGFVAGLHAGLTYNTFPLMDGRLMPEGYWALPGLRNLTENIPAVQFDHRLLATCTALLALGTVAYGLRAGLHGVLRTRLLLLGGAVLAQYVLGVSTLLWVVPVPLATAHQAMAVLLLTAALALLHAQPRTQPSRGVRPSLVDRSNHNRAHGVLDR